MTTTVTSTRALSVIAAEIRKDWTKVSYSAAPYLDAMACLTSIDQDYGSDSDKSVVLYFLSNANAWRGDTARRVKAELRAMAGK